jgi:HEAT repeat protein
MKTAWIIVTFVIFLAMPQRSFASAPGNAGELENFDPAAASDLVIVPSEPADGEKLQGLLLKLHDPDPFIRVEAVQGLGEIQHEQSLVSACGCLKDENLYVRAYAAEALGKIGRMDISLVLSKLLPALDDPSPYVRSMMILSLGELQDERALDSVRKHLDDEDESVRGMAAWAVNNIENSH